MGSRSKYKGQPPKKRSGIETGKPPCIRCGEPMFNAFTKKRWCADCVTALQQMSFNGEEVLEMILTMMPPTPPHPDAPIKAMTVLKNARIVMLHYGILEPQEGDEELGQPDDDGGGTAPKPALILT